MSTETKGEADGRRLDFDLERTEKADGRYVLFYSWSHRAPAASRTGDDASSPAPEQRPSSPETDPAGV